MNSSSRYYLVAAEVLPEIFIKVAEANRLLKAGEVATAGDAAKAVGISRSAYYKYRDAIQPFTDMSTGRIIAYVDATNPSFTATIPYNYAGMYLVEGV